MWLNWTQTRSSQQQADGCNESCDRSIVCAIKVMMDAVVRIVIVHNQSFVIVCNWSFVMVHVMDEGEQASRWRRKEGRNKRQSSIHTCLWQESTWEWQIWCPGRGVSMSIATDWQLHETCVSHCEIPVPREAMHCTNTARTPQSRLLPYAHRPQHAQLPCWVMMMVMMLLDNTSRALRMEFLKKTIETLKCSIPFLPEISDLMNSDRLLFVIRLHSKMPDEEGEAQACVVHHHRHTWSSQPSDGGV